jgi:formylmethanofuran dehydrogenase subunit B
VTCTLGEIRNRAELVIFWGSDPLTSHPRHWERYSVFPQGRWLPGGKQDRYLVVADTRRTASADAADFFLPVEPRRHFEALVALRAMIQGTLPDNAGSQCAKGSDPLQFQRGQTPFRTGSVGLGAPAALLAELAVRMRAARCGAMFFGVELARGPVGHVNVQALLQLVTALNVPARWFAMRMRVQGNVVGADTVMNWQTGYPFAVNLARGYPRYNPGEFSVQELLERAEVDACLLIGSETLAWLSPQAVDRLRQIPVVVLDAPDVEAPVHAAVRFRTAIPGIHLPGTAYRMDGVPVPLRAVLPARYPSDEAVLSAMRRQLNSDTPQR